MTDILIICWLLSSGVMAIKVGGTIDHPGDDDELCLAILYCVFWPVAALLFWASARAWKRRDTDNA